MMASVATNFDTYQQWYQSTRVFSLLLNSPKYVCPRRAQKGLQDGWESATMSSDMKIAVIGKGGREHALIETLAASPVQPQLFSFPGSDAIFQVAQPIPVKGLHELIDWMKAQEIDLCIAGEESYLVKDEGLANLCAEAGIPCWGPRKESAQLEASKEFAKQFLMRHGIPTGRARAVSRLERLSAGDTPPC